MWEAKLYVDAPDTSRGYVKGGVLRASGSLTDAIGVFSRTLEKANATDVVRIVIEYKPPEDLRAV